MIIIGVDPGLSGAIAALNTDDNSVQVYDVPTLTLPRNGKAKREVDHFALARIFDDLAGEALPTPHVFVEQVGAMPGQGVSSVFAFGRAYGVLIGVCAANFLPLTFVNPRTWKRELKVPAAKDGARARASALLPRSAGSWSRAKDDGRAEAALIALYGAQQQPTARAA